MQLSALGVATPLAINLAAIGEAAAFDASDYKALVCIFMYGGNDYANTVIPYDPANYALYHQIRAGEAGEHQSGIALARADLAATALTPLDGAALTDNLQYALAPQLTGLKSMFDAGRLAIQLNVGPLIQPTTLAQYQEPKQGGQSAAAQTLFAQRSAIRLAVRRHRGDRPSGGEGGSATSRFPAVRRIPSSPAFPRAAMPYSSRARMRCSTRSARMARSASTP